MSALESGAPFASGFAGTFEGAGIDIQHRRRGCAVGLATNGSLVSNLVVKNLNSSGYIAVGGCLEYMDYLANWTANLTITAPNAVRAVGGICGYCGVSDVENPTRIHGCTANFIPWT